MNNKRAVPFLLVAIIALGVSLTANVLLLTRDTSKKVEIEQKQTQKQLLNVDRDGFQAVFLENGQVYFGKLSLDANGDYVLTKVSYLNGESEDGSLVRLGNEAHQPKDAMYISRENVSFWENLKDADQFDGKLE
jgi:hypothetical protein